MYMQFAACRTSQVSRQIAAYTIPAEHGVADGLQLHDWCQDERQFHLDVSFLARDSMLSALYAIANPSVRLFVTRVDQSKTVEVRIMQFSPYSSPIPLVCAG